MPKYGLRRRLPIDFCYVSEVVVVVVATATVYFGRVVHPAGHSHLEKPSCFVPSKPQFSRLLGDITVKLSAVFALHQRWSHLTGEWFASSSYISHSADVTESTNHPESFHGNPRDQHSAVVLYSILWVGKYASTQVHHSIEYVGVAMRKKLE